MEKDFTEWVKERCCAWYLLTQEQEDEYFSQWYDEMQKKGKEAKNYEMSNERYASIGIR